MARVFVVQPDASICRLLEIQLGLLGHELVGSGEAPPEGPLPPYDVLVVDPHAPGALDFARASDARLLFISTGEPNEDGRALGPIAHLTLPYTLSELGDAL